MDCKVSFGSIHYKVIGKGRPFVILHSMGTDHRAMEAWLEPIFNEVDSCKRVYVDLPAHGYSTINEDFKGTEQMAGNIMEFIEKTLGGEKFSLIGMSYGGYIAQGILDVMGEQVEGIALLVPAVHNRSNPLPQKVVFECEQEMMEELDRDVKTAFQTLMVVQTDTMLKRFRAEIQPGRELADRVFLTSNWRDKNYFFKKEPFIEQKSISIPALFLTGKQDFICGYEDQYELYKSFLMQHLVS
ncbi:alpha/beta fold hydrolase [Bacillus sp. SCS-153A]|uniref:alpha/beta fold hydrolase n=1 Tax=Rossellomorea sedimentorum TaxID=3115294 RepID=UPI003906C9A4